MSIATRIFRLLPGVGAAFGTTLELPTFIVLATLSVVPVESGIARAGLRLGIEMSTIHPCLRAPSNMRVLIPSNRAGRPQGYQFGCAELPSHREYCTLSTQSTHWDGSIAAVAVLRQASTHLPRINSQLCVGGWHES